MRKVIFTMFFLVVSIVFSENFSNYTEVSEPEYMLIYEVNNLLKGGDLAVDPVGPAEDGKYKVVDENLITYLTIEKSSFNGKIYLFDRKTNKKVAMYSYKYGIKDGKWIEYDSKERPRQIEYFKNGLLMKQEIFVNGKFVKRLVFPNGIEVEF